MKRDMGAKRKHVGFISFVTTIFMPFKSNPGVKNLGSTRELIAMSVTVYALEFVLEKRES